ncbi:MAG: hypothetical protein OXS29_18085 [bacterium]|nr:hypothetical protein [bacterium]MDE0288175.1 hypothetical protein [bacterium]MDE0437666.1 hypothetical protein [bacterium]
MASLGLNPDSGFSAAQWYSLLGALDRWTVDALGEVDEPYALLVVGGAAISMQWNPRRLTHDVDVVSEGLPPALWKGAAEVAAGIEGVRADWINNAAKIKVLSPLVDADPTLLYEGRNLRVYGASARYVTAMKAFAGRPWDLEDLPGVLAESRFESLDEAFAWVERAHAGRQVPVSAQYYLQDAWDAVAAASQRRSPAAAAGSLWVHPSAGLDGGGWGIELRQAGREPLTSGVRYPSIDAALEAAGFAQTLLNTPEAIRFEEWEHGRQLGAPCPGDRRLTVVPVSRVGGWELHAVDPDGNQRAVSLLYPTQQDAASAQRFLQDTRVTLTAHEGHNRVHLRATALCACPDQGVQCHHHIRTYPTVNQLSVRTRPCRGTTKYWEVAVHGVDGSPVLLSPPFPTEDSAVGGRDFALAVVNADHPIRFEGWKPWLRNGPGYLPPSADEAATTLRIKPPPSPESDVWRLQARRADGYVLATSLPYPSQQAAAEALDFVGALSVLAGDPARAGRVRDTTSDADRTCSCLTLGADCLHYETAEPDTLGRDRVHRGPDIGL